MKNTTASYPATYLQLPHSFPTLSLLDKNGEMVEEVDLSVTHLHCRVNSTKGGLLCFGYYKPEHVSHAHLTTAPMRFDEAGNCFVGGYKVRLEPHWSFEAWLYWNETTEQVEMETSVITRNQLLAIQLAALDSPAVGINEEALTKDILFTEDFGEEATDREINEEWQGKKKAYSLPPDYKAKLGEIKQKFRQS